MIVIPQAIQTIYFDVDDTLICYSYPSPDNQPKGTVPVWDSGCQSNIYVFPHKKHIQALKDHKKEGHTVVVWSQGGSQWCEDIVQALRLQDYVDLVIDKPTIYYDDLHCSEFLGKNTWLSYEEDKDEDDDS